MYDRDVVAGLMQEIRTFDLRTVSRLYKLINKLERQIPKEGDALLAGSCFFYRACTHTKPT